MLKHERGLVFLHSLWYYHPLPNPLRLAKGKSGVGKKSRLQQCGGFGGYSFTGRMFKDPSLEMECPWLEANLHGNKKETQSEEPQGPGLPASGSDADTFCVVACTLWPPGHGADAFGHKGVFVFDSAMPQPVLPYLSYPGPYTCIPKVLTLRVHKAKMYWAARLSKALSTVKYFRARRGP